MHASIHPVSHDRQRIQNIMLIIYHNPRCSKSRAALELAQQFAAQQQLDLAVVDYQKTPLTLAQLTELHQVLQSEQAVSMLDMTRDNEEFLLRLP